MHHAFRGVAATAGGTATLEARSRVTSNVASNGGGIFNNLGSVTLGSTGIVTHNNQNNCAGSPAVANCLY